MGGTGRAGAWVVGNVAAAAGLVVALTVRERAAAPADARPLVVHTAASLRPAFARIAADYEAGTGRRVELLFGASEEMLTRVRLPAAADPGDLFAPADESYVTAADKLGLVAESHTVARMRAVLLLAPKQPPVTAWGDLASRDMRVSLANEAAAIGRLTRQRLTATGLWRELEPRVRGAATVTDSANAARLGAVDAAIVWDAVARQYPDQQTVDLPELTGVEAEVRVAVLRQSARPADADRFLRFVLDPEHGLKHFRDLGFRVVE